MTVDIHNRLYKRGYLVKALAEIFTSAELDEIKEYFKNRKDRKWLIKIERCALTYEQVQQYNLPPSPTKRADPRSKWYIQQFGDRCWELDAVEPRELERIIEESILKWLNRDKWNETLQKIEKERKELRKKIENAEIKFAE